MGFGVWLLNSGIESRRYSREVTEIVAIACILIFSVLAILSFLKLCIPPELILTPEGFSVRGLRKPLLIAWNDVERFELISRGSGTMVGYVLKPDARSGVRDQGITRLLMPGYDGTIAVFPDEKPIWVLGILNEWRERYALDAIADRIPWIESPQS